MTVLNGPIPVLLDDNVEVSFKTLNYLVCSILYNYLVCSILYTLIYAIRLMLRDCILSVGINSCKTAFQLANVPVPEPSPVVQQPENPFAPVVIQPDPDGDDDGFVQPGYTPEESSPTTPVSGGAMLACCYLLLLAAALAVLL